MATQRELAEHLDLHPTTISELIKKGVIPAGMYKKRKQDLLRLRLMKENLLLLNCVEIY
jgi:hypothetical protein